MKLPVLSVVVVAYQILFANLRIFLRLVWIPFLICCFGEIVTIAIGRELDAGHEVIFSIVAYGVLFGTWLSTIPAITAWHRLVILGADSPQARIRYTVGRTERTYLWKAVLFYVALNVASTIVAMGMAMTAGRALLFDDLGHPHLVGRVFTTAASLVGFLVTTGCLLVLPAAAIGQDMSLRDSLEIVRGNVLRLFGAYMLAGAPQYFLLEFLWAAYPSEEEAPAMVYAFGYSVAETFIVFCFFTITISVLSIAYKLLVYSKERSGETA